MDFHFYQNGRQKIAIFCPSARFSMNLFLYYFMASYIMWYFLGTFLIYTNICSIWSFSENCEMQHMQVHIQTLPRCTLSTPMWTLMETSISTRNFFLDFDDTISRKECLLLTSRMHAMNYNQMIFCAIINKIWIVRKSLAKLAVTEEFGNSLLLHSLLSINQNKTLRNDVKL